MATLQSHIETLERYAQHGLEPGSGTRAILENDLYQAARRLDASSQLIVFEIVRYMVNHLPPDSWGSRERVDAWIRARRGNAGEQAMKGEANEI